MARKILILGASYGSLLGTKLLMAGQDVTLVCRQATADLINAEGTEVRIRPSTSSSRSRGPNRSMAATTSAICWRGSPRPACRPCRS